MKRIVFLTAISSLLWACQGSDNLDFKGNNPFGSSNQNNSGNGTASDPNQTNPGNTINYPTLRYSGNGSITFPPYGNASIVQSVTATLDSSVIKLDLTDSHATSGDKLSEVNKSLTKMKGPQSHYRPTSNELTNLQNSGNFIDPGFILFSIKSVSSTRTYTFSKPLPILIAGKEKSYYSKLDSGPLTYSTIAEGGITPMNVTVTVSKISESGDIIKIRVSCQIPKTGIYRIEELYEDFPIPWDAEFTIDTQKQKVTSYQVKRMYLVSQFTDPSSRRSSGEQGIITTTFNLINSTNN